MQTDQNQNTRTIPPIPGGGSWTFDEAQWTWISNDPAPVASPAVAEQAADGTKQAATAVADQE